MPITSTPDPPDHERPNPLSRLGEEIAEEAHELREEVAERIDELEREVRDTRLARWSIAAYLWLERQAPATTRGKIILAAIVIAIVLLPSLALLYVTLTEGQAATQDWFGTFGYAGVFLANLASTATVFIPVPGLTAAGQALIASSGLNPIAVGLVGGLGMALGEITAYVAGMAGSQMVEGSGIQAPRLIRPAVEKVVHWIDWLMDHYGVATLFFLSAIPNLLFEIAGLTAGANRMHFGKFLGAVILGKCVRGLILAYVGTEFIFG